MTDDGRRAHIRGIPGPYRLTGFAGLDTVRSFSFDPIEVLAGEGAVMTYDPEAGMIVVEVFAPDGTYKATHVRDVHPRFQGRW